MDTQVMRNEIAHLYGEAWKIKVGKMTDKQIQAVYFRLKRDGVIK